MGLFLAGFVKGATGLGYSTCALPFLVAAIGLRSAIVIVPIPAMAANIGLLFGAGHIKETLHRFWIFYAASIPGIFYGTTLLTRVDQAPATEFPGRQQKCYRKTQGYDDHRGRHAGDDAQPERREDHRFVETSPEFRRRQPDQGLVQGHEPVRFQHDRRCPDRRSSGQREPDER